jgi:hypothetical protein
MNKCLTEYSKTDQCKLIRDRIADICAETIDFTYSQNFSEFMNPQRKFINYILEETYTKYLEEDGSSEYEEDDIIVEEQPLSPFSETEGKKREQISKNINTLSQQQSLSHLAPFSTGSKPVKSVIKKIEIKPPQNTSDDKFYDFSS